MKSRGRLLWLTGLLMGLFPHTAWGQGCAMCRSSLLAQAERLVSSLNLGILVLLFPPLAILGVIVLVAFQRD